MNATTALPLAVVAPLVGAVVSLFAARLGHRLPLITGMAAMGASTAALVVVAGPVYSGDGQVVVTYFSGERPVAGHALGIAFAADPFGTALALLTAALGLLLLLSALSELGRIGPRELGGLACLIQLLLAGLIAGALTADLVNLFVWFEVAALASYGLTGFFLERPIALEAAFKILVLTSIASYAVFIGAALLYAEHGALNLGQLGVALRAGGGVTEALALALFVLGFGTKAGLVPFHAWLPDAHTPVPGAVSALFSALMVTFGVVGLARLFLLVYPATARDLALLTCLGLTSALVGALMALGQDDLKRLLAWDTVSQIGIVAVGLGSRSASGEAGAVFHLLNHAQFKALLFLCAGAVVHSTGETRMSRMGGLARQRPFVTAAFTVGVAAIAGAPPLNAYPSLALLHRGLGDRPGVLLLADAAQVVTVAALGRAAYLAFYRTRSRPYPHLETPRAGMYVTLATLAAACLGLGVVAGRVVSRVVTPAASLFEHPAAYATAVLGGGGRVPALTLGHDWLNAEELVSTAIELVLGIVLAVVVVRRGELPGIGALRRLHTGIVNDYAAFAVAGFVVSAAVVMA